jgi:hypothetical protein
MLIKRICKKKQERRVTGVYEEGTQDRRTMNRTS